MSGEEYVVPDVLRSARLVPRQQAGQRQPMRVTPGAFRAAGMPVPQDRRQWNVYQLSGKQGWPWTPARDNHVRSRAAELLAAGLFVCIDCDVQLAEDGTVQLDGLAWLTEHAATAGRSLDLSGFVVVRTPGNAERRHGRGWHLWARAGDQVRPGPLEACPAVEIKTRATCPGSPGYEALSVPDALAALPAWIAALAKQPRPAASRPATVTHIRASRYAAVALRDERENLLSAEPGDRNAQLNRSAYAVGQIVGAGMLDRDEVFAALLRDAEELGLVAEDGLLQCRRTIQSGLDAGMARPRRLVSA